MARRKTRRKKKKKYWIQEALKRGKKGALHRQLGVPSEEKIPTSLLRTIQKKEVGSKIRYKGKKIPVTPLLKKRANLALTLASFH